jgi:hypothetical protein
VNWGNRACFSRWRLSNNPFVELCKFDHIRNRAFNTGMPSHHLLLCRAEKSGCDVSNGIEVAKGARMISAINLGQSNRTRRSERRSKLASIVSLCVGVLLSTAGISSSLAAAITPGNIVIYRVGDGSGALSVLATPVFLDEYTPAGTLVQSIPLPTTGTGSLTAVGNASTEGIVSLSQDKTSLIFTGYRKDAGGTTPVSDSPATTNRVIAWVGISGVVNTSVGLTDPTGTIRSATTVDGSAYYISTSAAIRYVSTPGAASTSTSIDARNSRQVNLSANILYAANGSTAITAKVQSYGPLPTGTTAPTSVVNLLAADAVNSFSLFDLSPGIAGDDTLYATSTVEGMLRKYTFDGFNWNATGSFNTSAANVVGVLDGGNVNLYLTSGSSLLSFTDTTGYGGVLAGSPSSIATAGTNTAFRGVNLIPVPEPSTVGLIGLAATLGFGMRRRKSGLSEGA